MKIWRVLFNDGKDVGAFHIHAKTKEHAEELAQIHLKRMDESEFCFFAGRGWAYNSVEEDVIDEGFIPY